MIHALQIHIITCYIHLYIHHTKRSSYLFHSSIRLRRLCSDDSDFPENQRQSTSFSMNVANLFLSFKWATTLPNKLIDSQHYKRLRWKILIAFLSHFTLRTKQLNLSFLNLSFRQ